MLEETDNVTMTKLASLRIKHKLGLGSYKSYQNYVLDNWTYAHYIFHIADLTNSYDIDDNSAR